MANPGIGSVSAMGTATGAAAVVVLCGAAAVVPAFGQVAADPLLPPTNGVRRADPTTFAFVRATVHVSPEVELTDAILIIRDGKIVSVEGKRAPAAPAEKPTDKPADKPAADAKDAKDAPKDAAAKPAERTPLPKELADLPVSRVIDCQGLHIYATFIDPFIEVDAPIISPDSKGAHWSDKVMPQRRALDGAGVDEGLSRQLRSMGFGAVAMTPKNGIFRGSASVVSLGRAPREVTMTRPPVYRESVYQSIAMEASGGTGNERWSGYPDSQMGAIALIRQTLLDADYESARSAIGTAATGPSALKPLYRTVAGMNAKADTAAVDAGPLLLIDSGNELETLRAARIAAESARPAIIVGSGLEFRRLDAIAGALAPGKLSMPKGSTAGIWTSLMVPLTLPEKPKAGSPGEVEALELRDMMTWEQAPTNLRRLETAGLRPALTTSKLRDRGRFTENLRTAIRHGVDEKTALAMVTTRPAELLGVAGTLGTLEKGKQASFIIADGAVFAKKTKLREVWVDGQRHELNAPPFKLEGTFALNLEATGSEQGKPVTTIAGLELVIDKDGGVTIRGPVPPAEKKQPEKGEPEKKDDDKPAAANPEAAKPDAKPEAKPEQPKADGAETAKPETKPEAKPAAKKPEEPKRPSTKARNTLIGEGRFSIVFDHDAFGTPGVWTLSGLIVTDPSGRVTLTGSGITTGGTPVVFEAQQKPDEPKAKPESKADGKDAKDSKDDAPQTDKADFAAGTWNLTATSIQQPEPVRGVLTVTKSETGYTAALAIPDQQVAISGTSVDPAAGTLTVTLTEPAGTLALKLAGNAATGTSSGAAGEWTVTGTRTLGGSGKEPGKDASKDTGKEPAKDGDDEDKPDVPADLPGYPFGAYAIKTPPKAEKVIFTGATIWTATAASKKGEGPGIIENGAIVISDGQILFVGKAADLPKYGDIYRTVDVRGKHITPGIIDCHSHTGISGGVNEAGQAVTSEVRIGDVTNPDVQNWYRQLAGGVTAVNNLHGSANPIGGQNQVNKIRWGCINPDDMHMQGATPGIKFALGENVKQSNSGDRSTWRYPQTRMGVETIIRDRFVAAREYAAQWEAFRKDPASVTDLPRVDLELEALAEILAGKRLIHCHSYRQDEILMLARIAQEFGFKIGSYQHILEGYKVAEVVRDFSLGGSGFSDWWAFKVEVQDAIPQAGPIMHEAGAVVSYNSDSDELARRLNVEAGKAVKYSSGSVSPHEALQFVTLNPAKQLKIESRTGSLEVGKDADLVVWSGDPLSSFSLAEQTWVDGTLRFSRELDKQLREQNQQHRTRLLAKIMNAKKPDAKGEGKGDGKPGEAKPGEDRPAPAGPGTDTPRRRRPTLMAEMWDQARAAIAARNLDLLRRGIDPANTRRGECGCEE